ncbi:MAG: hypothetical protein ABIT96_11150 [Ferruginibacter sp.]
MKTFFTTAILQLILLHASAQVTVRGTVYDNSKVNFVENVRVVSSGGMFAVTDSLGHFEIPVFENDSLSFFFNNKFTQQFAVSNISNLHQFDISLRIPVKSKYSVLKEVILYANTHKQDSLENRQTYADVFDYHRPGIETSIAPGGAVGADVNELINIFRFRRNRNLKNFQQRLQQQEEDKYIDYRFNKTFVRRVTGLNTVALDTFMVWYRPSYLFAKSSSEIVFNQYVLNSFYAYNKMVPRIFPALKPEEHY